MKLMPTKGCGATACLGSSLLMMPSLERTNDNKDDEYMLINERQGL